MSLRDFPTQNLASNEVFAHQHQLHLVEDELNLLSYFQRTIGFNLDLLNYVGGLVGFAILLEESAEGHSGLRIFSFKEHFALTGFSESLEHFVLVGACWKLLEEFILAHVYHFNHWFFRLTPSFAEHQEEFTESAELVVIESQLEL